MSILNEENKIQKYLNFNPYYVYGEKETPLQIEEKKKKYFTMPLNLRLICVNIETSDTIEYIAINKYALSFSQAQKIAYLVRLVFFGELAIADFINRLSQELRIDKNIAQNMALDINKDVFKKVSPELKEIQKKFNAKQPNNIQQPIASNMAEQKISDSSRFVPVPPDQLPVLEGEYSDRPDKYLEPLTRESAVPKPVIKGNLVNLKPKT